MSGVLRHHVYCKCGSALHAASSPADAATLVVDWFLGAHNGPGHALTDSAGASRGRARKDRTSDRARHILAPVFAATPGTPEGGEL